MVVIESGGTKSTWRFVDSSGRVKEFTTIGLHPRELSDQKIEIIRQQVELYDLFQNEVYFFGAGCESQEARSKITQFLQEMSLHVKQVDTDIYGACVAHLGRQPGVVGILGTGAVAAQFDGHKVTKITSGWGYLLGDEGSGFDIGKRLLQLYLNDELSDDLKKDIDAYFNNKSILHRVYAPDGRMFVAGLTRIASKQRSNPVIHKILQEAFSDFCHTALSPLEISGKVHFIGSIAHHFSDELQEALEREGYELGKIQQEAIFELFNFIKG